MAPRERLADNPQMDESPEELEQIRREAAAIDPYRYRRRLRVLAAVGVGALGAGVVWAVLLLTDRARNPCERVRDHYCKQDPASAPCKTYQGILAESVEDDSPKMRGLIRGQCETKIARLKDEEGVTVP